MLEPLPLFRATSPPRAERDVMPCFVRYAFDMLRVMPLITCHFDADTRLFSRLFYAAQRAYDYAMPFRFATIDVRYASRFRYAIRRQLAIAASQLLVFRLRCLAAIEAATRQLSADIFRRC